MKTKLREYQIEAVKSLSASLKRYQSSLVQLPTGTGKTRIMCEFLRDKLHKKVLIAAHTEEIVTQIEQAIYRELNVEINRYTGSAKYLEADNNIAAYTIQSTYTKNFDGYDYLIVDEAHHAVAETYRKLIEKMRLSNPKLKVVGFTATVKRNDDVALNHVFETISFYKPIKYFVDEGFLMNPESLQIECDVDLSRAKVSRTTNDFIMNDLLKNALEASNWKEAVLEAFNTHCKDLRTIAFCASVEHSEVLCKELQKIGISAAHLDGKTKQDKRSEILQKFYSGETQVVCNHGILTEGYDNPLIEAVIMARPVKSQLFYIQAIGRALRTHDNKKQVKIIDFTVKNHNLVQFSDLTGTKLKEKVEKKITSAFKDDDSEFRQNLLLSLEKRKEITEFYYGNLYEKIIDLLVESNLDWGVFNEIAVLNGIGRLAIVPKKFLKRTNLWNDKIKADDETYFIIREYESERVLESLSNNKIVYQDTIEMCLLKAEDLAMEVANKSALKDARWKSDPATFDQVNRLFLTYKLDKDVIMGLNKGKASQLLNYYKLLKEIRYV